MRVWRCDQRTSGTRKKPRILGMRPGLYFFLRSATLGLRWRSTCLLAAVVYNLMLDQRQNHVLIGFVEDSNDIRCGQVVIGEEITDRDLSLELRA